MAAQKKTPRRAAQSRKTKTSKRKTKGVLARLEDDFPKTLKAYSQRFRKGLTRLERDLVKQELSARRKAARLLREASHQLGRLEARGEREFKRRATRARKDADRVLTRLERAIDPTPPRRKKKAVRATAKRASSSA
ncbi:MAG: hypothetical protein JRG83_02545 [Deltaproteobacteria bacterium]|nr:hypothetical protein [Deltaproteobacteria bacterium]